MNSIFITYATAAFCELLPMVIISRKCWLPSCVYQCSFLIRTNQWWNLRYLANTCTVFTGVLLGIEGNVGKFSCSPPVSWESPQGISKIHLSVCLVQFPLLAVETFAYQLTVSRPKFSHSTPHRTIPCGSRRCRECIVPRILLRIFHSFIFRVSGATKVSAEVNIQRD
jgi:hypothetical protein